MDVIFVIVCVICNNKTETQVNIVVSVQNGFVLEC